MSGGSWDYLYRKDIINPKEVIRMGDRLMDVAAENQQIYDRDRDSWRKVHAEEIAAVMACGFLLKKLGGIAQKAQRDLDGLRKILHAVEWWDSGDWGMDSVIEAWEKWWGDEE